MTEPTFEVALKNRERAVSLAHAEAARNRRPAAKQAKAAKVSRIKREVKKLKGCQQPGKAKKVRTNATVLH